MPAPKVISRAIAVAAILLIVFFVIKITPCILFSSLVKKLGNAD